MPAPIGCYHDKCETLEEITQNVNSAALWIQRHVSIRVYFKDCLYCGNPYTTRSALCKYCSTKCQKRVSHDVMKKTKGLNWKRKKNKAIYRRNADHVIKRTSKNAERKRRAKGIPAKSKTGIRGVCWQGNIAVASVCINSKPVFIYRGYDFFEACCARKSAEARIDAESS